MTEQHPSAKKSDGKKPSDSPDSPIPYMCHARLCLNIVNCSELLDELSPPFPAVLIDLQLLKGLKDDDCRSGMQKIRVAVDVQYLNDVRKADFPGYNIIYYDKSRYKDFLLFFDTESRILPRVSFSVYGNFSIPLDVERFLEFWNRSELVDCIGLKMFKQLWIILTNKRGEIYIIRWYRECGIIPHTYDVDFAAFIGEYNPQLLEHLQSNETKFFLSRKFGRKLPEVSDAKLIYASKADDSFEFTLRPLGGGRPMMDLFWMYTSANESWVGGTSRDGTKYKYSYPRRIRICAGDLLGHIFWVPCDPETIIVIT
ncbi:hypothetical protein ANCCEY_08518 [Ancylostoma ceylanicum]|uniref:W02B3.4-like N-terminal domain-containing protein n=1 Tax=Ancylostoma ceylanicum TaxID=53326 RepID=A0A0D6LJZ8_9BILA|nr:hypothetical protein ANCCEY_08518 [Ancylostoma ceylanicum]